jgi:hypothetical protein
MLEAPFTVRIMSNGSQWYWEVLSSVFREVVARGISDTHAQARVDANKAIPSDAETVSGIF